MQQPTPMLGAVGADILPDAKTIFLFLAKQKEEQEVKEEEQRQAETQAKARWYLDESAKRRKSQKRRMKMVPKSSSRPSLSAST